MANNFGKGIKVTSGFDLSAKGPLDNRTVVDTIAQRDAHVSSGRAYEGLKVYVINEQKEYTYTGVSWVESGGITQEQLEQLTVAYAHSMTEHVSKEAMEDNFNKINKKLESTITASEVSSLISNKADLTHSHNDSYYTKQQTDEKIVEIVTEGKVDLSNYATIDSLNGKADWGHSHTFSDIEDLSNVLNSKADKTEVATIDMLAEKSDVDHGHSITDIGDLQNVLDLKANITSIYNKTELNIKFSDINSSLNSKADSIHNHNDIYYTQKEVDDAIAKAMIDGEVDLSEYATLSDLNTKSDIEHGHDGIYAKDDHNHDEIYYKKGSLDELISNKADLEHGHDDKYYTQQQIDTKLQEMATNGEISLTNYVTQSELTERLGDKAEVAHTHTPSDVIGLNDLFVDIYKKSEVDSIILQAKTEAVEHTDKEISKITDNVSDDFNSLHKIETIILNNVSTVENKISIIEESLLSKSNSDHSHDDKYYDKTTVENMIKTGIDGAELSQYATKVYVNDELLKKADHGHQHTVSDVLDLSSLLDNKINKDEAATKSELTNGLANKSDSDHNHNESYAQITHSHNIKDLSDLFDNVYSESEIDTLLDTKADFIHNHDDLYPKIKHEHNDLYYTKEEINSNFEDGIQGSIADAVLEAKIYTDEEIQKIIGGENNLEITTITEVVNHLIEHENVFDAYKKQISDLLSLKTDVGHDHNIKDISGLQTALDLKADKGTIDSSLSILEETIDKKILEEATELRADLSKEITAIKDNASTEMDTLGKIENAFNNHNTEFLNHVANITEAVNSKADSNHNHDEVYSKIDHVHSHDELEGLTDNYYNKNQISDLLNNYSEVDHGHDISEIAGLQEQLDLKANISDVGDANAELKIYIDNRDNVILTEAQSYTNTQIANIKDNVSTEMDTLGKIEAIFDSHLDDFNLYKTETTNAINNKADSTHNHDEVYAPISHTHELDELNGLVNNYYDKNQISDLLKNYSEVDHGHDISGIAGLQEQLDSKANSLDVSAQINNLKIYVDDELIVLETESKRYTDGEILKVVDGAPDNANTLNKLLGIIDANKLACNTHIESVNKILETKADITHNHDEIYAPIEHKHELDELNGLDAKLEQVKGDAVTEAVTEANEHTDNRISSILGDNSSGNTISSLLTMINDHINDFETYQGSVSNLLAGKSDLGHGHEIEEITGLQTILNNKAETSKLESMNTTLLNKIEDSRVLAETNANNYTNTAISNLINNAPEALNTLGELADAIIANKNTFDSFVEQITNLVNNKSDSDHNHNEVYALIKHKHELDELNGLEAKLDQIKGDAVTQAVAEANEHTDTAISNLVDSAPEALNTLKELANAITENKDIYDVYVEQMTEKLNAKSDVGHVHDDKYSKLNHKHDISEINNLGTNFYNKSEIEDLLVNKSDSDHNHDDLYSEKNHTHKDMVNTTLITEAELEELLLDIFKM